MLHLYTFYMVIRTASFKTMANVCFSNHNYEIAYKSPFRHHNSDPDNVTRKKSCAVSVAKFFSTIVNVDFTHSQITFSLGLL